MKFLQCLVSNHRKDLTSYLFSVRFKFTTFHSQRISSLNRVEITSPLSIIYKNVLISSKSQTCQPPKVAQLYLHDARRHPRRGGRARDRHRHRPLRSSVMLRRVKINFQDISNLILLLQSALLYL